jgi:hypothetical protein
MSHGAPNRNANIVASQANTRILVSV